MTATSKQWWRPEWGGMAALEAEKYLAKRRELALPTRTFNEHEPET